MYLYNKDLDTFFRVVYIIGGIVYLRKLKNISYCLDRLHWAKDVPDKLRNDLEEVSNKLREILEYEIRNSKQE